MQKFTAPQPEHIRLDELLMQAEGVPAELEVQLRSLVDHPDAEELCSKDISRNKRAVIERSIALWVSESNPKPYAD